MEFCCEIKKNNENQIFNNLTNTNFEVKFGGLILTNLSNVNFEVKFCQNSTNSSFDVRLVNKLFKKCIF